MAAAGGPSGDRDAGAGGAGAGDAEGGRCGGDGLPRAPARPAPWDAAPDSLAIPLEGAADAEVMVTFGAGHLRDRAGGARACSSTARTSAA